jgi:enoyl-CoA hydratase
MEMNDDAISPVAENSEVTVERVDNVLIITINRPEVRNAVNHAAAVGVATALDMLESDSSLVVGIITGAGGTFCSGMDLKAFLTGQRPEIEGRGLVGLTEAPPTKPMIAAVEGYALAGGCEIALACDMIVAADDAVFGIPEVKRGLVAGSGGLVRLPQRIPTQIAMEYALTGAPLSATDAHRWGLVNRITPHGGALVGALALAKEIAANAPLAVQLTKRIIRESADWSAAETWSRQNPLVENILASDDAREGAAAFAEKRPPKWAGR